MPARLPSFTLCAALASCAALVLTACPEPKQGGGGPEPSGRCEADLAATGLFSLVGSGAVAKVIEDASELIGGQSAEGRVGDYLLQNDRIRVVISQPGRNFAVVPFGGWIVDADLKRPAGEPGRDQFGRMGLLYAFGRTINAEKVEVLEDGSNGGAAIIAATGHDALSDFVDVQNALGRYLPDSVKLVVDANQPVPLKATTYYVLSPGESRVRVFTQLCNEGNEGVSIALGDLLDQGGSTDFFNPEGCVGGMGREGCLIDSTHGFGYQGDQVAYGYRGYQTGNLSVPGDDAQLSVDGPVGVLAGAEDSQGVLSWVDPQAAKRPGAFGIRAGESRPWLRDFYVTRDLAELTSAFLLQDLAQKGRLEVTVKTADGAAAPGARVGVVGGSNRLVTLMVADGDGRAHVGLPPGSYQLVVGAPGHAFDAPTEVTVGTQGTAEVALTLGAARTLTVTLHDPFGVPMPGKVTVLCPTGTCPTPMSAQSKIAEVDKVPTNVAAIGLVPPSGTLALQVPPGQYEVVVTRGPEYSAWPLSWPVSGQPVDLSQADQALEATLAHVVDTRGWLSADLHVHAVNSPDSDVANEERVLSFLAEGVDVLVSTDHDFLTDFGPVVRALGGEAVMATMVGSEISTFDFGHFNAYPMVRRDEVHGGPVDWAGGTGPTLRATEIFATVRTDHPDAILQVNHGRGRGGVLTTLEVDTDTFASHRDPADYRMAAAPDATATDTRLFNDNFDAFEIANGLTPSTALLNDWMTMLSSGRRKVATGVSDTHTAYQTLGGYSRTLVEVGDGKDDPAQFDPGAFTSGLKGLRAIGTNGPFVRVSAHRLDGSGNPVGGEVPIGGTLSVAPDGTEQVELTVEVQAPEWMKVDTLEVYTHADGREALGGQSNDTPPTPLLSKKLDPAALAAAVEPVPGLNGFAANRFHIVEKMGPFTPVADTWYVVLVRGSSQVGTLYPLAYSEVSCKDNLCTANAARAYAFTNPIFVDADGSGAYDHFPQKVSRALRPSKHRAKTTERTVPTLEQWNEAWRQINEH